MFQHRKYSVFIFLLFVAKLTFGQIGNWAKTDTFLLPTSCEIQLDPFTIIPSSILIEADGFEITSRDYKIRNTGLVFDHSLCKKLTGIPLHITFRTFDFNVEKSYTVLDTNLLKKRDIAIQTEVQKLANNKQLLIEGDGLDYRGSFSRGFSVGNAQSLLLNSNFNLQLRGDLGDGLVVTAAISDNNIPIQPEGNTRLIQEFDRVFIEVAKGKNAIVAGDYQLQRPKSYFINYFKKLQGFSFRSTADVSSNQRVTTNGSFAVSRGKFARQIIANKEGNQGPYKLLGNNGERFLIVLSGSEKVYWDGRLLERGLEYDYVIDYNRAEITFTPKNLVARETRIIVEYEYQDQNYPRSLYAANAYFEGKNYDFNFNFYSEQDSKKSTGDIVLDSNDIMALQLAGDDILAARRPSIIQNNDTIANPRLVRYEIVELDSPSDTSTFFLRYSTDFSKDLFAATFTEVGESNGRYTIDDSLAVNGRVFRYVGPGLGAYEPITVLIPPEKRQMIALGGSVRLGTKTTLRSEASISNFDVNRLSSVGDGDNSGFAGVLSMENQTYADTSKQIVWNNQVLYEHLTVDFQPLNPYRNAEFNRDWNIRQFFTEQESLVQLKSSFKKASDLIADYTFKHYEIENNYSGYRHLVALRSEVKDFSLLANADYLTSEGFGEATTFFRPKIELKQAVPTLNDLEIGVIYDGEFNQRRNNTNTDFLLANSYGWNIYRAYVQSTNKDRKLQYRLQLSKREDLSSDDSQLVRSIATNELEASLDYKPTTNNLFNFSLGYRDFNVERGELLETGVTSKKTLLSKIDFFNTFLNGAIVSTTNYILNSGQEPKVEFFFERVEVGQGDYIYIGNEDSTLLNTNFRYAPDLGTANYIRLSLVNNEFIATNNQQFNQTLKLEPKVFFASKEKKTWSRVLSKFSYLGTFRANKKVTETEGGNISFFDFSTDDPDIVSYNGLLSSTIFFNRGNSKFDFQVGNRKSSTIFTQIAGREERALEETYVRTRIRVIRGVDGILEYRRGYQTYNSLLFDERDLDIISNEYKPTISWRPGSTTRVNVSYEFANRNQQIGFQESANSHNFSLETTYRKISNYNLSTSLSLVNVSYSGEANSPIEFDLLEGLKNGRNYLWNVLFSKRLNDLVDLTISYEGRKNGDAPTINIARAQVKATF